MNAPVLAREGITPRHLARLNAVQELDAAPFNWDTDQALIDAGLLEALPNGDVQLTAARDLSQLFTLCACTSGGRQQALTSCPDCRGEGVVSC